MASPEHGSFGPARIDRAAPRARALAAGAALVVLAAPARGSAAEADVLGYDTETGALAGSTVAYGRSLGVIHTNPALLPDVPSQVHLAFQFVAPRLHVDLMPKPPGTNVPMSIYDSSLGTMAGLQDRSLPTAELQNARRGTDLSGLETNLAFGFATSFGLKHLRAGAIVQMPLTGGADQSISTHYDDEREAAFSNKVSFARFGQWERIAGAAAGVGYELAPWLSIGLGLEISAATTARIGVYIPNGAVQSYSESTMDAQISIGARPILAARWTPTDWSSIGLVWRNESYFSVDAQSEVTLWNYHETGTDRTTPKRSQQSVPAVFGYRPMEVSLGAGVIDGPVTLQLAATWQRWSHYLDQHGNRPEEDAPFPPSPLAQGPAIDASQYAFHDTVNVAGGLEWQVTEHFAALFGAAYQPSPVPPQVGRTSFADGNLYALTTGARWTFSVWGRPVALSVAGQFWAMQSRTTYKDPSQVVDELPDSARTVQSNKPMPEASGLQTNNPGFPGYTSGGHLVAGSVALTHTF
jgi:long-subunit fatty acid transport protein